jgi:hypothetical protein
MTNRKEPDRKNPNRRLHNPQYVGYSSSPPNIPFPYPSSSPENSPVFILAAYTTRSIARGLAASRPTHSCSSTFALPARAPLCLDAFDMLANLVYPLLSLILKLVWFHQSSLLKSHRAVNAKQRVPIRRCAR